MASVGCGVRRYEGHWTNGMRGGGVGVYDEIASKRNKHGFKHVVDWEENRSTCWGKLECADGSKYIGMWVQGYKHGYGTLTLPDLGVYNGEVGDCVTVVSGTGRKQVGDDGGRCSGFPRSDLCVAAL